MEKSDIGSDPEPVLLEVLVCAAPPEAAAVVLSQAYMTRIIAFHPLRHAHMLEFLCACAQMRCTPCESVHGRPHVQDN